MKDSVIRTKSMAFAIRVVKLYKYLVEEKKEFVLSKQLLRAGTSVGANVHEACFAQSKKDFISKMQIALKESNETHYWIALLSETDFLTKEQSDSVLGDIEELIRLLQATVKTSKTADAP